MPRQDRPAPESGHEGAELGDDDVARVQRAVMDAGVGRRIERARQAAQPRHEVVHRRRAELLQRDVERIAFGEGRDQERGGAVQAGLHDLAGAVLPGHQAHERVQLRGKRGGGFRGEVESEELDGQRSIGLGMHRAKYRTTRAGADLVQDTKAADGRRWNVEQRTFPGHVLKDDLTMRS